MEETRFQKIERLKKQERGGGFYTFCASLVVAALLVAAIFVPALPLVGGVLSGVSAYIGMGGLTPQVIAIIGAPICAYGGWKVSSASKERARIQLKDLGYSGQQSNNSYGNEGSRENKDNNEVHNEPENKKDVEAVKATMQQKEVNDEASLGTKKKAKHALVEKVKAVEQNKKKQQNKAPGV